MSTTEIAPEIRLAIEAGIKDALKGVAKTAGDARDAADPDQTLTGLVIDMQLEIDEVKIGHDSDKSPTCSIPMLATLALFIKRMGFQRDKALETLQEVMQEAMTLDKDAVKALMAEAGVAEAEQAVREKVIAKLPRSPVKKTVRIKGATLTVKGAGQRSAAAV